MDNKKYLDADYNKAYLLLSKEQHDVIDNYIKIGYKTKWLYIFEEKRFVDN